MIRPNDITNRMAVPPLDRAEPQHEGDQAENQTSEQDNEHAETKDADVMDRKKKDSNDAD